MTSPNFHLAGIGEEGIPIPDFDLIQYINPLLFLKEVY
jgi:hypothetical protein